MNKKTILNIQEIASLKSGMKTLEEIRKTHDGTSMGKLPIGDFVSKYGGDYAYHEVAYDKDGKIIDDIDVLSQHIAYPNNADRTDSHVIFSMDASEKDGEYFELDDGTAWLTTTNLDYFDYLNKYRSLTSVGGNGSSMSVIRNNKFSPEDAEKFKDTYKKFDDAIADYFIGKGANPTMSMQEFIKKNGWDKQFEDCNIKLRFQKNSQYVDYKYDKKGNYEKWEAEYQDYKAEGGEPIFYDPEDYL